MSARSMLRLLLLVQLAGLLVLAAALARAGLHWPVALLAAALALVLVRALIFTNNFRLSARHASPTPIQYRIGGAGALRLWGEEFVASMLQSSWHTPRGAPCQRIFDGDGGKPPVLLLHGYGCNSGYWHHLRRRLARARISHACIDLQPVTGDIDGYATQIEQAAARLAAALGAGAVIVVAHSMGGLCARAWLRTRAGGAGAATPAPAVARVITLGTPHHGTCLAHLGVGTNAAQMRRPSATAAPNAWLAGLAAGETAAQRALLTSIFSHHDNIIAPQTSSVLDGACNLAFGGIGHVALGSNSRILDAVIEQIDAARHAHSQAHSHTD